MSELKTRLAAAVSIVGVGVGIVPAATAGAAPFDSDFDWSDEAALSTSHVSYGDVVGMWQQFINWIGSCGKQTIDGSFGPITKLCTQAFQLSHGLSTDGIVGPATYAKAKSYMTPAAPCGPSINPCQYEFYTAGYGFSTYWYKGTGGTWKWSGCPSATGQISTDYPAKTFTTC